MNIINFIDNLRFKVDGIFFESNGYSYQIQAINSHIIRFTAQFGRQRPDIPTIVKNPEIKRHSDPTIATGGGGQKYQAPIVVSKAKTRFVYSEKANSAELGKYVIDFNSELRCIDLVSPERTLHFYLPIFTEEGWVQGIQTPYQANFFGGGVRNGVINLTDQLIKIENENLWTKGGITSPSPFIWCTEGFGILVNTFTPGEYDFTNVHHGISLSHQDPVWDIYVILGDSPLALIHGYHELTGKPAVLPWFSFYPAHFNAYNRDYWVPVSEDSAGAVKFSDGFYKEYQPIQPLSFNTGYRPGTLRYENLDLVPNVYGSGVVEVQLQDDKGLKREIVAENLNGETSYEFSARAVIEQYLQSGMPLGWLFPNDGYGAGYGQTSTFKGDLLNLANLSSWAHEKGVEIGLWTQSQLMPEDSEFPQKGERNLKLELSKAKISAVKIDVAWVGEGYTFGVNAAETITQYMSEVGKRPMILAVDGWAGSQRNALVWSGDQAGSHWENIRTQVATFISSGLSGFPNITADVDGIYAGDDPVIFIRDLEWKAFTQTLFSMDGWGNLPKKLGMQFSDKIADISRAYARFHVSLIPHLYSLAHLANRTSAPIVRPTFWIEESDYTLSDELCTQFLLGDQILIAPIMSEYHLRADGSDLRPQLYLPKGDWIDFWTNEKIVGGRSYSDWSAPLDKVPAFVKSGAIVVTQPIALTPKDEKNYRTIEYYPGTEETEYILYEDDKSSLEYTRGQVAQTLITAIHSSEDETILMNIHRTKGSYIDNPNNRELAIFIVVDEKPKNVEVVINDEMVKASWYFGNRQEDPLADQRKQRGVFIDIGNIKVKRDEVRVVVSL